MKHFSSPFFLHIALFIELLPRSSSYSNFSPFLNGAVATTRNTATLVLRRSFSSKLCDGALVSNEDIIIQSPPVVKDIERNKIGDKVKINPLLLSFSGLSEEMGGSGKAKLIWESMKAGKNPLLREESPLSGKAIERLKEIIGEGRALINCEIISEALSECGTRKLLVKLADGGLVESVLIPSYKFDRTTLCISTQIGCDRGCVFCATGKMGLQRNLTASEIIGQVFLGLQVSKREGMPLMSNIVFMGMGDAGRNTAEVGKAVHALVDRNRFCFAQSKVTVSTVGPSPEVFSTLAEMPGTIAWSLHAADDVLRKKLVPSTKHTTAELRDGLKRALSNRPSLRMRTIMIAATLIDGVNDSDEEAERLAAFLRPMLDEVPKIAVDLIPYNDIGVPGFGRPSDDRVCAFQAVMRREGYFCSVRITRGDDDQAACGMLSTKKQMKAMKESSAAA